MVPASPCSSFLTLELLPVVVVPDHVEPLEPPLQAGPDPTQVLDQVIAGVKEDGVEQGDGQLGVDEGDGGGLGVVGGLGVGGDERGELDVEVFFKLLPVAVGLDHPQLVALRHPLHRPVLALDPFGVAVSPILAAETEDARVPARGTLVQTSFLNQDITWL